MQSSVHPVDEMLPAGKLTALGLQHVLVMYAGAVAVPLIVGRALNLPPEQVAHLISADLFCCGLITLIQAMGTPLYTDVRLYGEAGIPGVIYGAGPRTVLESHAKRADERLVLEDLRRATKVIARMLCDLTA